MSWRAARVAYADVARVAEALDLPEPVAWTLVRRGLADPDAARSFIDSSGPLAPPEDLAGVSEAADRLARAVADGERIAIHGDYDCDGICSTAILAAALRARGGDVVTFLPSRFEQGYGVADDTVDRLAAGGARVLVCVDCGTSAVGPLTRAVELGLDPVVLDHHLAGGVRPPGILVNPALGRPADDLPAAAGVVHMVVRALAARLDGGGLVTDPDEGIDLVALATVADAVPLVGDNRRRVAQGLRAIRERPRPGIAALCAAAGLEPRVVSARGLGFTLAPAINASGRLAHPDRALELLLSDDRALADPIGAELWSLNAERREVERAIVDEAIAMVEAEPDDIRAAGIVLVAGDGWHEGVVGIVAARLAERFLRPAIVLSRSGDAAKGSGRSVPGVDLHALVAGAAGSLTRWGGHAGAIGVELPCSAIARFRDELFVAAEGARAAIARARVLPVDAVVSGRDLTLPTAEALEALAPFGRGNPPVRLAVPAAELEGAARVGQGQHLQVRLRSAGVHSRAIGFRMGDRMAGLVVEDRHDALVGLEVERWQGIVGPRVSLDRLEHLEPAAAIAGQCAQACDAACPERSGLGALRLLLDGEAPDPAPPPSGPPRGVRDHRGRGAALATLAALAGADRGVVAVVADVARRREALVSALAPARLGVEVAVLAGARCDVRAATARLGLARGVPALAMVDYARLPDLDLPPETHVVLVDPPSSPEEAAWAMARAAGRWLHLTWGEAEVDLARRAAEDRWELRPTAAALWRALRGRGLLGWDEALDLATAGDGTVAHLPAAAADALAALGEIGLLEIGPEGILALDGPPSAPLEEAPRARACRERLEAIAAYLELAPTIDLEAYAPVLA